MVKVLLADNHAVVRDGILRLLADDPRIEVVAEASDFSEAIIQARDLSPDVLIADIHMPFERNLSLRELGAQLTSCKAAILGLSFANDEDAGCLAMHMGAAELLGKAELEKELVPAILRLAFSNQHHPPTVVPNQAIQGNSNDMERHVSGSIGRS